MPDERLRRLVERAYAKKGIPERHDSLIKDIGEIATQIATQTRRSKGGRTTSKISSRRAEDRREILAELLEELPKPYRSHPHADATIDRLEELMRERSPHRVARETLISDIKKIKRKKGGKAVSV